MIGGMYMKDVVRISISFLFFSFFRYIISYTLILCPLNDNKHCTYLLYIYIYIYIYI